MATDMLEKRRTGVIGLIWSVLAAVLLVMACCLSAPVAAWAEEFASLGEAPLLPAASAHDGGDEPASALSAQDLAPAAVSQSAATRTEAEIRLFIEAHPFNMSKEATYAETPSATAPYAAGQISAESEQEALNALNVMRYIAGIPADVTIDAGYRSKAQAGALVNAANNSLEHKPSKPSGMDNSLYQQGYSGDSSSNIAAGYSNPAASVLGYMNDFGSNNYGAAGHRVWLLDYSMGKTGFGQVGRYGATYVFDNSRSTSYTDIAWPARTMPTCLFDKTAAWSFLADRGTFKNVANLKVTLTRNRGGKTWTFANPTDASDSSSDFFATTGYTGANAMYQKVLFYPSEIDAIQDGDVYAVSISDGATTKRYTVSFFDLYKPDIVTIYDSEGDEVSSADALQAEIGDSPLTYYANPSFSKGSLPDDEGLQDLASGALSNYAVSWSSGNDAVVSVEGAESSSYLYRQGDWLRVRSRAGLSFKAVGTTRITAALPSGASASLQVQVRGHDIANATVAGIEDQKFDGSRKTPAPVVEYGGEVLVQGVDYTVEYGENTSVGTGVVTIVGRGDYEGRKTVSFAIREANKQSGSSSEGSRQDDGSGWETSGREASSAEGHSAGTAEDAGTSGTVGTSGTAGTSESLSMHRLYNQWSGEHFYTSDEAEYANLVELGWTDEGEGWTAPSSSDTPVFRLYNPYAGEHHYTMDAGERDSMVEAGWTYEDIGWYSDDAKAVPLFREYNPFEFSNNHNYTTSKAEHDGLVAIGWVDEGYAWYGV